MTETTLITRTRPLKLRRRTWTPVPMDTFHGGDSSLITPDGRYIEGRPGAWLFGLYVRLSSNGHGQRIVQFCRDIGGPGEDCTGTQDFAATPGKDYLTHMWFFHPTAGKPTGIKVYSSRSVVLEYAQLKAVPL